MTTERHSTGIPALDQMLGGGLLPGTLTVVIGATGIGKTQLGVQFASTGRQQEKAPGVFFDLSSRGDSQSHSDYASRVCQWQLQAADANRSVELSDFFEKTDQLGDYLHLFDYGGRRVTKQDLDFDHWRNWQAELNAKLRTAIAFLYGSFVAGKQRVVVDGIEPTDKPHESIQFNLFEYVYHQILRKEPEWVARDLFRERYRENSATASKHLYNSSRISCLLLCTSQATILDELIEKPLDEGDVLSNANTLIYMGKTRDGNRIGRGLYIAKHRGSACSEDITPYRITESGLEF